MMLHTDKFCSLYEEMPYLERFPPNAKKTIEHNIHRKMYDYYKKANAGNESYTAFDYYGKRYTFAWLNSQIDLYARALKGYGIKQGDVITVLLPNMPEFAVVEMAINRVGAVANIIDPRFNPNYILKLVNNSHSRIVICVESKYKTGIKPIRDRLTVDDVFLISPFESLKCGHIKTQDGITSNLALNVMCFISRMYRWVRNIGTCFLKNKSAYDIHELLKREKNCIGDPDTPYTENAPAVVLYTSGTTGGLLKGAVHTNEGFNALHAELEYAFPEEKTGMSILGCIPMSTSYGNGVGMFNSLCSGFEIKTLPIFNPSDLVKIIDRNRPNIIVGVPKFVQMMADSDRSFEYVSHIIIGGDKLLPNKFTEFRERFPKARIAMGYGETEFLGVVSVTLKNEERPDSSGAPLPGMKIKVINTDTCEEVPFMQEGEAFISGLTQMVEYLNNPEETEKITWYDSSTGEKYFSTGDIIKMTPEGEVIFLDRKKHLMKRPDGHQVNPDSIEKALSVVEGIKEICVVGLQYKDIMGVIPTAFIKPTPNKKTHELVEECEKTSIENLPSCRDKALAYVIVDALPYTSNGKVDALALTKRKLEDIPNAVIVDNAFIEK